MIVEALMRSLENPSTSLSDPDEWLYEALGGSKSVTGLRVGRKSALTYSPAWRAVNLIARDVGKLPLFIYHRLVEGGIERATEHPAYRLLRHDPNSEMTAAVFRATMTAHALLLGNGYAYIHRAGDGTPLELIPLNPENTHNVRVNGVLWYVTLTGTEAERKLAPVNVIHIKGLGFDGLTGYSIIEYAKNSIGVGLAAQQYGGSFFARGARPSAVIEHPAKLSAEAVGRLRTSWEKMHEGLNNAHRAAILDEGMKLHAFGATAKESQLLELQEFSMRDVANWFGVPPHKIGDTTRTSYASLEQENQAYLDDALDPWLHAWESECRAKLLTETEKKTDSHVIEFLRAALVRADLATRYAAYNTALQGGWMSRDEIRAKENENPIPDSEGKKFYRPLNVALTGEELEEEPELLPEQVPAKKQALREALRDVLARAGRRIHVQARRAALKGKAAYDTWISRRLEADHAGYLEVSIDRVLSLVPETRAQAAPLARKFMERICAVCVNAGRTQEIGLAAVVVGLGPELERAVMETVNAYTETE